VLHEHERRARLEALGYPSQQCELAAVVGYKVEYEHQRGQVVPSSTRQIFNIPLTEVDAVR